MTITKTSEIYRLLNQLAVACGYPGESGTEAFFHALFEAVKEVDSQWDIVDDSHQDGFCYDVNVLLAEAIAEALIDQQRWEARLEHLEEEATLEHLEARRRAH